MYHVKLSDGDRCEKLECDKSNLGKLSVPFGIGIEMYSNSLNGVLKEIQL